MRIDTNSLTRRRLERRMTQGQLAAAVRISASHMSRIEAGTAQPSPSVLGLLADALECDPADLIVPVEGAA